MKRSRQGRANLRQIMAMLEYLEKHPHIHSRKFAEISGRSKLSGSWEEMSEYLNSLAADGRQKDVKSWKTTWRDHKTKVFEKLRKIRNNQPETGSNKIGVTLTDLDKRILRIISTQYTASELEFYHNSFSEEYLTPKEPSNRKTQTRDENVDQSESVSESTPGDAEEPDQYLNVEYLENDLVTDLVYRKEDSREEIMKEFAEAAKMQAGAIKALSEAARIQAETNVRVAEAMETIANNSAQQMIVINQMTKLIAKLTENIRT